VELKPQSKPQTDFLKTTADICIFGGSAGGGKTFAILFEPLRYLYAQPVKGFQGVIFRREIPQITNPGGLWDEANNLYTLFGATPRQSPKLEWTFPSGGTMLFSHLQHDKDVHNWQGSQVPFIGFDELTHFSEKQFWYMLSRNRSTCGVKPYIRATCNPDPDSFVAKLVEWWIDEEGFPIENRSGKLRYFARIGGELIWGNTPDEVAKKAGIQKEMVKSFTFIPAKLSDNKILEQKDPTYRANLMALPPVEQARLLYGNWKVKQQGTIFKGARFEEWRKDIDNIMYVDPAFGGKNNTAIAIGGRAETYTQVKGWSWRESIIHLTSQIVQIAKSNRVGTIYIETNADKGASLRELKEHWAHVQGIEERENKHVRIMHNLYKNWSQIAWSTDYKDSEPQRRFFENVLGYEELREPDDEADALAGLIRRLNRSNRSTVMGDLRR